MRLWHEYLIPFLPNKQLIGQHRECCALRGNGWGRKHSIVDYVFRHPYKDLYAFHMIVIDEMYKRGFIADEKWLMCSYRGKNCEEYKEYKRHERKEIIYKEHDDIYLKECIQNLKRKNTKPVGAENWDEVLKRLLSNE